MRVKLRNKYLTPAETNLVNHPDKRQLESADLSIHEADKLFDKLPWALVIACPSYYFFRE